MRRRSAGHLCGWLPLIALWVLEGCAAPPAPPPAPAAADPLAQANRPFAWRLEDGARSSCTIVVRATRPLASEDADELDAVLTDWYNLGRLGAYKDAPGQSDSGAIEAMGTPWQPHDDTLAATFDLGTMGRLGFVVLLNALAGYHDEEAPIREVILCATQAPPPAPPGGST